MTRAPPQPLTQQAFFFFFSSPSRLYLSGTESPYYPQPLLIQTSGSGPSPLLFQPQEFKPAALSPLNPRSPGTPPSSSDLTFPSTPGAPLTNTFPAGLLCQCVHFREAEAKLSSFCRQSDQSWSGSAEAPHLGTPPTHTHSSGPQTYPALTVCFPGALPVAVLHPTSTGPWVLVNAGQGELGTLRDPAVWAPACFSQTQ